MALTFDDGPHPEGTPRVLDLLSEWRVTGAFFVIGANVQSYPDLLRRMDNEGHLVCNHSYDHAPFAALRGPRYWLDQISRTDRVIAEIIGRTPSFFRPPWGLRSPSMRAPLSQLRKTVVGWTRRAFDGLPTTADAIVRRLAPRAAPGDVLVLHDGREPRSRRDPAPTIAALPHVIKEVRARGLEFVRLDRLIGREPYLAARTDERSSSAPASV